MFVGLGVGAFSAGVWHVMTHAFFKALLFLGAGSVIHALSGEQDLRKMGGLAKKIPITCITLFCAGVAIAGVPFTSGHYSKDAILEAAYLQTPWIYWVGVVTAGMTTAFYVFRALFLCFFGEYRMAISRPNPMVTRTARMGTRMTTSIATAIRMVTAFTNLRPSCGSLWQSSPC